MLRFAAARRSSRASTGAAVASSLANASHPAHTSISYGTSSSLRPRTLCPSNQLASTASFKLTGCQVKSMTEAVSTPKLDTESSLAGKKQALISLSDKRNLALLGNGLQELGYAACSGAVYVALDGRVKTLHPNIHGGILARRDKEHHMEALDKHGIGTFDVVVVNLYPFYDTVTSSSGISFEHGIENIDIGGPAMIRALQRIIAMFWWLLILKTIQHFWNISEEGKMTSSFEKAGLEGFPAYKFPPSLTVPLSLKSSLRYGENPHQKAAFYVDKSLSEVNAGGIATSIQHHGKEMSYNNYLDADAAWNCVCEFTKPTCVIVKHTNPCGVASRNDIIEAYRLAVKADPVSAFGGIVAFNVEVDEVKSPVVFFIALLMLKIVVFLAGCAAGADLAKDIREFRSPTDGETRMFYEIVVAPKYSKKGLEVLRGKSKTLRILEASKNNRGKLSLRQVGGGWLAQEADDLTPEDIQFNVVSEKAPDEKELHDAQFAWLCAKHVKSNAIVIAKNNCMLGMGSGQPNRRESLRIAMRKAGDEVMGAALASDAFFPFAWNDAVEEACQNGIGVIAEPGGSIRDADAIDCCNKYGVSLVFTNVRHFRH
ncbi:UNVERIFIED_CONTAM: Bifunctional purine biosynthesis protein PurH [Sesamum radiatum]|uniref:Bifunctional purine biosynthesis protein PurH n=1 Tax=Sesamum radiatum TaxID=300843 RepID=A0AAW2S690_SESRA